VTLSVTKGLPAFASDHRKAYAGFMSVAIPNFGLRANYGGCGTRSVEDV
jgi:hypothetical protein